MSKRMIVLALLSAFFLFGCDDADDSAPPADASVGDSGVNQDGSTGTETLASTGDTTLSWAPDEQSLHLRRGDNTLLKLPASGMQIGLVSEVSDNVNYNPDYIYDANPGSSPSDLTWAAAEVGAIDSDNETHLIELLFGEEGSGQLAITASADDRITLRFTPPADTQTAYLRVQARAGADEGFYGMGGVLDHVNHRGKIRPMQITLDTTLESGFTETHVPIPFLIGHYGWGLFVESLRPGTFSIAVEDDELIEFTFGTGVASSDGLQFHLFTEEQPLDLIAHYYGMTGEHRLPAPWAYGPWIWRDENEDQAQVINDVQTIRELDLATSGYWVDRPYASAVNSFDFKTSQFPEPEAMVDTLHALGFRFALWHTPYIGGENLDNEDTSSTLELRETARREGYFPPQTGLLVSKWGPLVDLTNPDAFAWFQDKLRYYTDMGVEGFKLDYAEEVVPGVFAQRSGWTFHDGSNDQTMHALYQTFYHQVYAELLPESGGFLLCRSATWGGQVNGPIIWPGDLDANLTLHRDEAEHNGERYVAVGGLGASMIAGLSLSASGFPFYGSDTGGYRRPPPNKETFARWFQQTALSSIMQVGTNTNDVAWEFREENGFDAEMLDWYRIYTRLHLRLFPYAWTYAEGVPVTGRPIQRPFGLQYPDEGKHPWDTYFFGDDLLVAPVVIEGQRRRTVPFPTGDWYDWWTGERIEGGQDLEVDAPFYTLPLYLRAGGIIPMLRPTIDTLSPATDPSVDSFANDAGRLYARIAPGPDHEFVLFDGTRIEQRTTDNEITILSSNGELFQGGRQYVVVGLDAKPAAVQYEDSDVSESATEVELEEQELGWFYEASTKRLHLRTPGPQAVVVQR